MITKESHSGAVNFGVNCPVRFSRVINGSISTCLLSRVLIAIKELAVVEEV